MSAQPVAPRRGDDVAAAGAIRSTTAWGTPAKTQARPRIELVKAPIQSRSRIPFVLLCMTLVATALIGALILNTTMARGAYEVSELESEIAQLAQTEQALLAEFDQLASPTALAERARDLGMVQDSTPAFIQLSSSKIIGDPTPAKKK